jgi:hypothetical protein
VALQNATDYPEEVTFFELFSQIPPSEKEILEVIQGALDRGVEPALIHRAARMLQPTS